MTAAKPNPLLEIAITIVLPGLVLMQFSGADALGPSRALVAALAGALMALWLRYVGPDTSLGFKVMTDILLIVVIGGMGTMYGAVVGAGDCHGAEIAHTDPVWNEDVVERHLGGHRGPSAVVRPGRGQTGADRIGGILVAGGEQGPQGTVVQRGVEVAREDARRPVGVGGYLVAQAGQPFGSPSHTARRHGVH